MRDWFSPLVRNISLALLPTINGHAKSMAPHRQIGALAGQGICGSACRRVDPRFPNVCRTVLQRTRPTIVLWTSSSGELRACRGDDQGPTCQSASEAAGFGGISREAGSKGVGRWDEVSVRSGVLKVQGAFWDKLEGSCPRLLN
jgi:hypothetical protein